MELSEYKQMLYEYQSLLVPGQFCKTDHSCTAFKNYLKTKQSKHLNLADKQVIKVSMREKTGII